MFTFSALQLAADRASRKAQARYLLLIRCEYILLIVASVLALDISEAQSYFILYALVFAGSLASLLTRSWQKPEQEWYKCRALAESIKTSCWRYSMRAEPFGDCDSIRVRRSEFRNYLLAILEANRHIGGRLPPDTAASDQITGGMEQTRAMSLEERKAFYLKWRIQDQRTWYARKAAWNKRASRLWVFLGATSYAAAILFVLAKVLFPDWRFLPVEPMIVLASSIVGWTQVKKFNELASSYTLTAHEIGIIQSRVLEVENEIAFSSFVNEAEQAFSREHTQWVARQQDI